MRDPEEGFERPLVYLMCDGFAYKIGISTDPPTRLIELQTGNPGEIHIVKTWVTDAPATCEADLHRIYAPFRIRGEWFAIPPRHIRGLLACSECLRIYIDVCFAILGCYRVAGLIKEKHEAETVAEIPAE